MIFTPILSNPVLDDDDFKYILYSLYFIIIFFTNDP